MQHHDAILPLQLKTLKLATFVMNWQKAAENSPTGRLGSDSIFIAFVRVGDSKAGGNRLARRIKEAGLKIKR